MARTLVVGEMFEGKVRKPTLSAVAFALKAKEAVGIPFDVLLPGKGAKAAAAEIAACGAEKILVCEAADLETYKAESYTTLVEGVVKGGGYTVAAACADSYGKDLMPRVAAGLEAGMASDIVAVAGSGGALVYTRPMYAGNVLASVTIPTAVAVVTVRQADFAPVAGSFPAAAVEDAAPAAPEACAGAVQVTAFDKVVSARPELTEAKVVVSGGRGLKSGENFKMLEAVADLLGGAVGATRAAVDAGFVPNDLQVGQTGKIVAPQLYFAVGLSGAIQHLAGMKSSKVIVAINKDEEAPIFSVADYGLVGDLFTAVPALLEELKKVKAAG